MKVFKFRFRDAEGHYTFKEVTLPEDAVLLVGLDLNGNEVYDGDLLFDYRDGQQCYAALNAFTYTKYSPPHKPCRVRKFNCVRKDDYHEGR